MNIIETKQEVKIEKQVSEAHYELEDIQQLIKADLEQKGFKTGKISLIASYGVVRDEWGHANGSRGYFKEAIAEILE